VFRSRWRVRLMTDDRKRPFSCGTQYLDWQEVNCCRCARQSDPEASLDEMSCEIEAALAWACIDDGSVSLDIARRMGLPEVGFPYCWRCKEFVPRKGDDGEA